MKSPPYNEEAERHLLGGILAEPDCIDKVSEYLAPGGKDFYLPKHQALFQMMTEIYGKEPIDIVILADKLKDDNAFRDDSVAEYLGELLEACHTTGNIGYYAKIIKEKSVRRALLKTSSEISGLALDEQNDIISEISSIHKQIEVASHTNINSTQHISGIITEVLEELHSKVEQGFVTGLKGIDNIIHSFQRTDVIVIGGRPSMGKSALATQFATTFYLDGNSVAYYPLEVGRKQLIKNILANQSRINTESFRTKVFSEKEYESLIKSVNRINDKSFYVDDTLKNVDAIANSARKRKREEGLDIIFVDHLNLMNEPKSFQTRDLEVGYITSQLKSLAIELNISVFLVCQLSREVERRVNKRPVLSDLRESGNIEQDADIVAFIYRDEYYDPETLSKNIAEINIAKYKNGPTGIDSLRFDKEFLRFENLSG